MNRKKILVLTVSALIYGMSYGCDKNPSCARLHCSSASSSSAASTAVRSLSQPPASPVGSAQSVPFYKRAQYGEYT